MGKSSISFIYKNIDHNKRPQMEIKFENNMTLK